MKPRKIKDAQDISKLITILRTRNFTIKSNDENDIKAFLLSTGYYKLSGYWLPYYNKKRECLNENIDFNKVRETYCFDEELRMIVLSLTNFIEVKTKSAITNYMCLEYDPLFYYDSSFFENKEHHRAWMEKFENEISYSDRNEEAFKAWYKKEYGSKFPLWVTFEIVNFNDVSKLYANLKTKYKKELRPYFNWSDIDYTKSWLQSTTILRNICAHNGRLFYRNINTSPKKPLKLVENNIELNNKRVFFYILTMKELLNDEKKWSSIESQIINLITKYPDVDILLYGFNNNWYDCLTF